MENDNAFAQSFVDQKNHILLDKLLHPLNNNLTEAAIQYVNFCDESFDTFISDKIASINDEENKKALGRIRYEVNAARRRKLVEADGILRGILSAGGLKQMEAKLHYHLRRADIDMAFMVMLHLNIEEAQNSKAEQAVQVMMHLRTFIQEHQDSLVSPPVRLFRMLVRTDDTNVRKQMLRQKLFLPKQTVAEDAAPAFTPSPQCEHIQVAGVAAWGGADVNVEDLEATIDDVLAQMNDGGEEQTSLLDLQQQCRVLRGEIQEVLKERIEAGASCK